MNIPLTLDAEQTDVLTAVVDSINATIPEEAVPYTIETHLAEILRRAVESYVRTAFDSTASALTSAAKALPYADRKTLIEDLKTRLKPVKP